MKKPLILIVATALLLAAGWSAWVYAQESRFPNATDLQQVQSQASRLLSGISSQQQLASIKIPPLNPKTIGSVTEQSASVAGEASKVLGAVIQISSGSADKPLPERALDYARYQYCKQVVDEYEKQ